MVLGRSDKQVQIYGQRVELGEIESHLNKHSQIERAFVIYLEEEALNKICAFIQSEKYNEKDLRGFLKQQLPSYMIPHFFYKLEKIPLSSTGKLDYKALQQLAKKNLLDLKKDLLVRNSSSEGHNGNHNTIDSEKKHYDRKRKEKAKNDENRNRMGDGSHALSNNDEDLWKNEIKNQKKEFIENSSVEKIEDEIKKNWEKRLNKKDFSKTENFFDIGGDSILAVSLLSRFM